MHNVIVTGGYGFIGSHLVNLLSVYGVNVTIVDDLSAGDIDNVKCKHSFYERDICDYNSLLSVFRLVKPDVVFHLAVSKGRDCFKNPQKDLSVNAGGTVNVLRCCQQTKVKRLVFSSTGSVYGKTERLPVTENAPTNPRTYYGVSKLCAENYIKMFNRIYGIEYNILRYFHVYGPRQRCKDNAGGVVGIFCRRAIEKQPIFITGDGSQKRLFTSVMDIVKATVKAANSEQKNQIYNVTSNMPLSILDLAEMVGQFFGNVEIKHIQERIGEVFDWDVSNRKIKEIGMDKWIKPQIGLPETFDWYSKNV